MARKMLTGLDLNAQRAQNAADGVSPTDLVTRQQLDNSVAGLAWKQPVRVATTTNGTLASAYANASAVDGVTLATGDRILLKNQTAGAENGIYTVNASGAPIRATDANTTAELNAATAYVTQGTTNADKSFTQTADSITLDTTALNFSQVGGGTSYLAGNGLSLTGSTFAVVAGAGIVADGTSTRLDTTYSGFVKRYAVDVPAGSSTATITHNLGTKDRLGEPLVTIVATGDLVEVDVVIGTNADTLTFATAPTTGQFRYSTAA